MSRRAFLRLLGCSALAAIVPVFATTRTTIPIKSTGDVKRDAYLMGQELFVPRQSGYFISNQKVVEVLRKRAG